jgi:hypothetical protein
LYFCTITNKNIENLKKYKVMAQEKKQLDEVQPQQEQQQAPIILQIEGIKAKDFLSKFDNLESAMLEIKKRLDDKESKEKNLLSRYETADILKVTLPTIDKWTRQGVLKSHILGRRVYYNKRDIEKLF